MLHRPSALLFLISLVGAAGCRHRVPPTPPPVPVDPAAEGSSSADSQAGVGDGSSNADPAAPSAANADPGASSTANADPGASSAVNADAATPPPAGADPAALAAAYAAAVTDAANAEAAEAVGDLVVLSPQDPRTTWDDAGRVALVTWTSWAGYDALVGAETTLGREVWATAAPNLAETCAGWGLGGDALHLRLEQRLGLPPGGTKDRFVTFWADPADVFRPCADPSVTTSTCAPASPAPVDPAHAAWVEALRATSYGQGGYPWTRLGYTYDWGADSAVGETEWVVRAGAVVRVEEVALTEEFCDGPE